MRAFSCLIVCILLASCYADDGKEKFSYGNTVNSSERNQLEETLVRKMNSKCSQNDISSCVMLKLVTYMNRMLKKTAIQVGDDVEITANSAAATQTVEPSTSDERRMSDLPEDDQMTNLLLDKAWSFVKTRSLRWKMIEGAELVVASKPDNDGEYNIDMSVKTSETGRGKYKNLGPILAAAAMKMGLLGGLAFKGLVLLVGKALLVSKIALLLASVIGLKKLFSSQKHVTYEVVAHPHHSHESSGHEGFPGWGRSDQSAHELAYSGQFTGSKASEEEVDHKRDEEKPHGDEN